MKFGLIFFIGLFFISTWAFGALDTEDLEDIRGMFKESEDRMRAELVAMETRLRAELVAVETRLRVELVAVEKRLRAEDEQLRAENAASEARTNKQLDRNFTLLLVALFGFATVVTGIPLTLLALQLRQRARDRDVQLSTQQREIDAQQQQLREQQQVIAALQQQLEGMHRDVETLKQHSIFR